MLPRSQIKYKLKISNSELIVMIDQLIKLKLYTIWLRGCISKCVYRDFVPEWPLFQIVYEDVNDLVN